MILRVQISSIDLISNESASFSIDKKIENELFKKNFSFQKLYHFEFFATLLYSFSWEMQILA
jgi:hypothetical protein